MSRIRVAVVGAGSWGRNHVRAAASMPEYELVAICDVLEERRAALRREHPGVLVTASVDEALDRADAVVVATPASSHCSVARKAVGRGKPALVEKPMALSVEEAEGLVALSDETGVPVLAGHLLVFHPAVERLRAMIVDGDLGDVFYLYSQRVNLGQVRPDENALWSFGPHDVSVAMFLLQASPVRVLANGRSYLQPGVEDVVFMTMEFPSGILAHVQMSWLDPHKERRLTVVGSRQMAVFDDMQAREKLKIYDRGIDRPPDYGSYGESLAVREGDIWVPRVENVEPLRAELRHFAAVVAGGVTPRVSARDGLEVVRILTGATASLASGGQPVALDTAGVERT